jgi:RES domain-containing protein
MADVSEPGTTKLYDVALSFAGEDRQYVRQLADFLRTNGVRVFYDEFEQAQLWGTDLADTLDRIYRTESDFVVMFISAAYATKVWTKHERRSALAAALSAKREYILPARFDNTELEGLAPTIAYLDLRKLDPGQLGDMVIRKLVGSGKHIGIKLPPPVVPGITVWRITNERYAADFSGRGAAVTGGRWTRPGVAVLYTAGSMCNAILELLVHVREMPRSYVAIPFRIPADVGIKTIYSMNLPEGWQDFSKSNHVELQEIGTEWYLSKESCVLSLPSVTVPEDRMYLLNPLHDDFSRIEIGEPRPVRFDARLFQ